MKTTHYIRFACAISLAISSLAYDYTDRDVLSWAQQTLMETLSASYNDKPADNEAIQKKYYSAAWDQMVNFFHEKLDLIRSQQLTLHPRPLTNPVIVASGQLAGFQSWRVDQIFNIPELRANIRFSVLVINAKPDEDPPFLIESLNMQVENY